MAKMGVRAKRAKIAEESRKNPFANEEALIGSEPVWDTAAALKLTPDEFENKLRTSLNYYNYFYSIKDLRKHVSHWAKLSKLFTDEELGKFNRANDNSITMAACSIAKATTKGMPLNEKLTEYLTKTVREAVNSVTSPAETATGKPKASAAKAPSIQERMAEKLSETIGELEGELDNAIFGTKTLCKVYDFLTVRKVPQASVGKIRDVFTKQADEIALGLAGKDKDLKEAYGYLTKKQITRLNDFFKTLFADLDAYVSTKKALKKIRAVKTPSKEKQVAKVKYMKASTELKITSISPMQIIGAKGVWVYDTKIRKLFHYIADSHVGTLSIKGTTIVGFDEGMSIGKTLRKPVEQLASLMSAGKVQIRTFMANIKAVEVRGTGRINDRMLLLKID